MKLNEDILFILGRPNFWCHAITVRMRELGTLIPSKAEDEQAHTINLMLEFYEQYGTDWRNELYKYLKTGERKLVTTLKDLGEPSEHQVYKWFQESTINHHIEEDGSHISKRAMFVAKKAWGAAVESLAILTPPSAEQPKLAVWYGSMPESNGKTNWTAILHRADSELAYDGHTIDRSEYPERVRYEADRVRYLIGELKEMPDILAYDSELHSGYVEQPDSVAPDKLDKAKEAELFVAEYKEKGYHESNFEMVNGRFENDHIGFAFDGWLSAREYRSSLDYKPQRITEQDALSILEARDENPVTVYDKWLPKLLTKLNEHREPDYKAQLYFLLDAARRANMFISNLRVPQNTVEAAIQLREGGIALDSLKTAIAQCEGEGDV